MAPPVKQPWERLDNESGEAYSRFMTYLYLGPARNVLRAYMTYLDMSGRKSKKKPTCAPGSWSAESLRHNWVDRAVAYDMHHMADVGAASILAFSEFVRATALVATRAVYDGQVKFTKPEQIVAVFHAISAHLPAEFVIRAAEAAGHRVATPEPPRLVDARVNGSANDSANGEQSA